MRLPPSDRRWDAWGVVFFLFTSLLLGWIYSHGRPFWSDELFGWMLVTDPSLRHMLAAWNAGADGGGVAFYLLARGWIAIFGRTELAFRLFSATGVGLAAGLTYLAARRSFSRTNAFLSVSLIWFSSTVVLWQMKQARFYGLLLAGVALAFFIAAHSIKRSPSRPLLLGNFLAHSLLVATHPFGAVYSACILAGLLLARTLGARARSVSVPVVLSIVAGWWPLLFSVTAMRNSAAVGKPTFWTTRPHLGELVAPYTCFSPLLKRGMLVLLLCALVLLVMRRLRFGSIRESRAWPLLLLAAPLFLSPYLIFLLSQRGTSVFVDRYLLPVVIAYAIYLCALFGLLKDAVAPWIFGRGISGRAFGLSALGLAAALILLFLRLYPPDFRPPLANPDAAILALLPGGLPVVFERCDTFDQMLAYHRDGHRFLYLLDWENILSPESPRGEGAGYHEMEHWRQLGYFSGSILPVDQFLPAHSPFVVVDEEPTHWFDRKIRNHPEFTIKLLGIYHRTADPANNARVWLVQPVTSPQTRR